MCDRGTPPPTVLRACINITRCADQITGGWLRGQWSGCKLGTARTSTDSDTTQHPSFGESVATNDSLGSGTPTKSQSHLSVRNRNGTKIQVVEKTQGTARCTRKRNVTCVVPPCADGAKPVSRSGCSCKSVRLPGKGNDTAAPKVESPANRLGTDGTPESIQDSNKHSLTGIIWLQPGTRSAATSRAGQRWVADIAWSSSDVRLAVSFTLAEIFDIGASEVNIINVTAILPHAGNRRLSTRVADTRRFQMSRWDSTSKQAVHFVGTNTFRVTLQHKTANASVQRRLETRRKNDLGGAAVVIVFKIPGSLPEKLDDLASNTVFLEDTLSEHFEMLGVEPLPSFVKATIDLDDTSVGLRDGSHGGSHGVNRNDDFETHEEFSSVSEYSWEVGEWTCPCGGGTATRNVRCVRTCSVWRCPEVSAKYCSFRGAGEPPVARMECEDFETTIPDCSVANADGVTPGPASKPLRDGSDTDQGLLFQVSTHFLQPPMGVAGWAACAEVLGLSMESEGFF